jgi:hypothetical protein
MLGRRLLITRQTTDEALETSRQRVIACIQDFQLHPCKQTHDNWVKAQNVASDMMLLHLRITNLQQQKMSEESDVLTDADIIEVICDR